MYSAKCDVFGVLNGNSQFEKFLPQTVSFLKILTIPILP